VQAPTYGHGRKRTEVINGEAREVRGFIVEFQHPMYFFPSLDQPLMSAPTAKKETPGPRRRRPRPAATHISPTNPIMYKMIYDLSMYAYIGFQSTYKWVLFLYSECINRYCFCTVNNVKNL
jgi:hypothetical protein